MTCTIEPPEAALSVSERETLARILADEAYAREEWERIQTLPHGEERHEAEEGLMAWRTTGSIQAHDWFAAREVTFSRSQEMSDEAHLARAAVRERRKAAYQAARDTR